MARNTIGLTSRVFIIDADSRFLVATRDATTAPLALAKCLPRDSCRVRENRADEAIGDGRTSISQATKLQIALPGQQVAEIVHGIAREIAIDLIRCN